MTDVDLQLSTFEMMILCASAFELCMESSLQPLKYRMDRIVDVLRAARLSSHDSTWESDRLKPI